MTQNQMWMVFNIGIAATFGIPAGIPNLLLACYFMYRNLKEMGNG